MRTRTRAVMGSMAAAGIVSAAMLIGAAAPASAATVPNNYDCSMLTSLCVQVNGRHVNGIPNACTLVGTVYTSGSPESICSWWY